MPTPPAVRTNPSRFAPLPGRARASAPLLQLLRRTAPVILGCALLGCGGDGEAGSNGDDSGAGVDVGAGPGVDAAAPDAGSFTDAGGGGTGDSATDAGDAGVTAIYAAPTGSGTLCTLASPCALADAVTAARAKLPTMSGDVAVYLRGGTYRLSTTLALTNADSGRNGHRVLYEAYPGETPVLSGGVQVTGFTEPDAAKQIWRAPLPSGATAAGRQLFVNGVRAVRARSAGSPDGVTTTATGFATSDGAYSSFANQASIEVVQDNDWKHVRCPLQSIASAPDGGAALTVLAPCWAANNVAVPNVGFPLNGNGLPAMSGISWIENAYELLTSPGQFYVDQAAGYVYYMPRSTEDLATADVELPVLETLVSLAGTPGHLALQNDTDPAVTYAGSWQYLPGRSLGDVGGDVHATTGYGDSATIAFNGSGLEVLAETNDDEAIFQVYVDGALDSHGYPETSATRVAQQVVYAVSGLASGAHTVKLVNASTSGVYLLLDAFLVVPDIVAPVHDIAFSGITFSHATWSLPSTVGYIDNQAGVLWDTSASTPAPIRIPAAVQVHRGLGVSFDACTFSHLGSTALDFADGTQNASLTGSTIRDTSGGGVAIGEVDDYFQSQTSLMTSNDAVTDNVIANVGVDYHDAVGVWAGYGRGVTIAHNDIGHTPYSGISIGWGWGWASACALQSQQGLASCRYGTIYAGGNQVVANYIHDVMGFLYDGGPIYTNGGQGDGDGSATSVLASNFVTAGNHTNNMLYQDEGSSYWSTHDNVTSLGGADWIGMWTPTINDITVGPANYTDNPNTLNNGTSITYTAPTLVTGGSWPPAALAIMQAAGLEPAYRTASASPTPTLDDDDQSLAYTGTWAAAGFRGLGDYDDNVHYTTANGDSVALTFKGTGVTFIAEKSTDQGQIACSVDGQSPATVDTSVPAGSPRLAQQAIFSAASLAAGTHVLTVTKSSGAFMTVDAFQISP